MFLVFFLQFYMVWEAWSWFFMLSLCFFVVCSKNIKTLRFLNTPQSLTLLTYMQTYSLPDIQSIGHSFTHSLTYWDIHDLTHLCLCYRNHEKNTKKAWQTMTKPPKPCKIAKKKKQKTWFTDLIQAKWHKFHKSWRFFVFAILHGFGGLVMVCHAFFVFFHGFYNKGITE